VGLLEMGLLEMGSGREGRRRADPRSERWMKAIASPTVVSFDAASSEIEISNRSSNSIISSALSRLSQIESKTWSRETSVRATPSWSAITSRTLDSISGSLRGSAMRSIRCGVGSGLIGRGLIGSELGHAPVGSGVSDPGRLRPRASQTPGVSDPGHLRPSLGWP